MEKGPNEKYPCSQIWKKDRTKNNPPCIVQPSLQTPANGLLHPPACGPLVKYGKRTELKISL